jgi:glycosyltransferase involved in cell wall biosynthesis
VKIAYVITRSDAVGGATIHVRDLARWMLDQGHGATVLIGGEGPVVELLREAGVPCRCLPSLQKRIHPVKDSKAYGEITAALRDIRPDLVSTHTAKAGWLGRVACKRLGIPAVYTPHGWTIGNRISSTQGRMYAMAERLASRWSSAIVCVSDHERQLAVNKGIRPFNKLHVVYNGVPDLRPELRARPGRQGQIRFVSVARFEAPKDHDTLLRAFVGMGSFRSPPCQLVLVGDGPEELRARRLSAELGVSERVRFVGYTAAPALILADANVFVLASRSEGFPRCILEAMRAGLPAIASDVGGVGEAIEHDRTGLLVPAGNVPVLTQALNRLADKDLEREEMGAAGRRRFESRFQFERMARETLAIYTSVLEEN